MDDKVCLTFDTTFAVRAPNTSHDLKWIRARKRRLWDIEAWNYGPQTTGRDGMIMVGNQFRAIRLWVAQELAQNPGALKMITNHERRKFAVLEESASVAFLRALADLLEQRIRPPQSLTVQLVHDIAQKETPDLLDKHVNAAALAFAREDWPDLRRALERVDVTADLLGT